MLNPSTMTQQKSTASLVYRLWREHVRHYRGRIVLIVAATLVFAAQDSEHCNASVLRDLLSKDSGR